MSAVTLFLAGGAVAMALTVAVYEFHAQQERKVAQAYAEECSILARERQTYRHRATVLEQQLVERERELAFARAELDRVTGEYMRSLAEASGPNPFEDAIEPWTDPGSDAGIIVRKENP